MNFCPECKGQLFKSNVDGIFACQTCGKVFSIKKVEFQMGANSVPMGLSSNTASQPQKRDKSAVPPIAPKKPTVVREKLQRGDVETIEVEEDK